jgi:protein-L-isoaspartate(D-aspartate) O-methyltransferase
MGFFRRTSWQDEAERMVARQLAQRDIHDERVLHAMRTLPRHEFMASEHRREAYADHPVVIGCKQTISQPYIVALTLASLNLTGAERALEIGTGSGYQTALLARLAGWVVTIERHFPLARNSSHTLRRLGVGGWAIVCADGTRPPMRGGFDAIAVSAAAPEIPQALLDLLAEGGRLVIPVGRGEGQSLLRVEKKGAELLTTTLTACRFVPLIGEQGFAEH